MGFIEEFRKKKEFDQRIQKERRMLAQQKAGRERWEQKNAVANDRIRRMALYDRSKQMFEESGLGALIDELGKLGGYRRCFTYPMEKRKEMGNADKFVYTMLISGREVRYKYVEYKYFEMEIDAEGTIKFKSGLLGSSTIKRGVWQRDGNRIESDLGKAYHNPRVKRYPYQPSYQERAGG